MTSLTATDLQGEYQGKLNGHLKSEDFLELKKYPTATLVIKIGTKSANIYTAVADLTIKDN
jgi:polyisoprenoid-binding protein YceI